MTDLYKVVTGLAQELATDGASTANNFRQEAEDRLRGALQTFEHDWHDAASQEHGGNFQKDYKDNDYWAQCLEHEARTHGNIGDIGEQVLRQAPSFIRSAWRG